MISTTILNKIIYNAIIVILGKFLYSFFVHRLVLFTHAVELI